MIAVSFFPSLTLSCLSVRSDLFQHRLWLPEPASDSAPHEWHDVLIPFQDFALTNSGDLSEQQIAMMRTRVRTIGVSVLGPKEGRYVEEQPSHFLVLLIADIYSSAAVRYELGIESIDAVSAEVAQKSPGTPVQPKL